MLRYFAYLLEKFNTAHTEEFRNELFVLSMSWLRGNPGPGNSNNWGIKLPFGAHLYIIVSVAQAYSIAKSCNPSEDMPWVNKAMSAIRGLANEIPKELQKDNVDRKTS